MSLFRLPSRALAALLASALCLILTPAAAQAAAPTLEMRAVPQPGGTFAIFGQLTGARLDTEAANTWKVAVEQASGPSWIALTSVPVTRFGSSRQFYASLAVPASSCADLRITVRSGNVAVKQTTTKPCTLVPPLGPVRALAGGYAHFCALRGGRVACWGNAYDGQLGAPLPVDESDTPIAVAGLTDAIAIADGGTRSCALRATGTVACWGTSEVSDERPGGSSTPAPVAGITDGTAVAVGDQHACVVRRTGSVACWGWNTFGQLGDGTTTTVSGYPPPVTVVGVSDAVAVTAGSGHTCALRAGGSVVCWGKNTYGQLGTGTSTPSTSPVAVKGLTDATAIAAGTGHTCALRKTRTISCWGWNTRGQLGTGTTTNTKVPATVAGITDATAIAVNDVHTCTVRASGTVACWGGNSAGEVGDGTVANKLSPTTVPGLSDAVAVGAGRRNSCAARADGGVRCWGAAGAQLGAGSATGLTPIESNTAPADTVTLIAGNSSTCSIRSGGQLSCWGGNFYRGAVYDGTPTAVPDVSGARSASTAGRGGCAVRGDRTVACWGTPEYGFLGNGEPWDHNTPEVEDPVTVVGLTDAAKVAVNGLTACAVRVGGEVACWGSNEVGLLGVGRSDPWASSSVPLPVPGLSDVVDIGIDYGHACVLRADHTVACWGYTPTRDANGQLTYAGLPVPVPGLSDATQISVGQGVACALRTGGKVSCWGSSRGSGALGNGTYDTDAETPVPVTGLTDATAVTSNARHTCALRRGGGVSCWGTGYDGGNGNGTVGDSPVPVPVVGLTDATQITTGPFHTCALRTGGKVSCWGQIGIAVGVRANALVPVAVLGF